ncbi:EndoU domain-containing protein, partial [Paenactinomyces guangxiensis]
PLPGDEALVAGALGYAGFRMKSILSEYRVPVSSGLGTPRRVTKAIHLPSWKKVEIDMDHILSGHIAKGSRAKQSGKKTVFPEYMTAKQIEREIRQAYRFSKKIETQGDRVKVVGTGDHLKLEMWVNKTNRKIETAYPIWK